MADIVDTKVVRNGRLYVVRLQNQSDSTGESAVTKVDVSTLATIAGLPVSYVTIDRIEYSVWGINYVALYWDADTDDEIATLSGSGVIDVSMEGGMTDPQSTGFTGDIKLTTDGATDGGGYDITLWCKLKQAA